MASSFFFKLYEKEPIVQGIVEVFNDFLSIVPIFLPMVLCYGIQTSFFVAFADSWEPVYIWGVQAGKTTSFVGTFLNDVVQCFDFSLAKLTMSCNNFMFWFFTKRKLKFGYYTFR